MQSESDIRLEMRSRIFDQMDNFQKICRDNTMTPEKAVHELRKSIKRIRALFRFLKPLISESDFHQIDGKLAKTGRSLTRERESTVNIDTFTKLNKAMGNDFSEQSREVVLHGLISQRNEAYSVWINGLNKTIANHQFTMSRIYDEIQNLTVIESSAEIELKALENSYNRAIRYYNESLLSLQTETIHKWRKQLKRLLFQLKFGFSEHSPEIRTKIKLLDKLTDVLGKDHDLALLERKVKHSFKSELPKTELEYFISVVDRERSELQKKAFGMGKELSSLTFAGLHPVLLAV